VWECCGSVCCRFCPSATRLHSVSSQSSGRHLGWTEGRNIRIDYRWYSGDADRARALERVSQLGARHRRGYWHSGFGGNAAGNPIYSDRIRVGH
jgi:hypothetical protein